MADKKKKKKRQRWIRLRHKIVQYLLFPVMTLFLRLRYGLHAKRFDGKDKQYLILANHQTAWDQFFMGIVLFPRIMPYYVASEDIFSNGFVSRLIRFLVSPIPIKKQTSDVSCVMNCMRIVKEGGSIAISPEGNRTYDGRSVYMKSSVAALARALKIPLALLRIEGGFGTQPRWSDSVRRGRIDAYVSRVVTVEEMRTMSDEELFSIIERELYVNDCALGRTFRSPRLSERMERAFYVCPQCGITRYRSKGNVAECTRCGAKVRFHEDLSVEGVGFTLPFHDTTGWYDYQNDFVRALDTPSMTDVPIDEDSVSFFFVEPYKRKQLLSKNAKIRLYGDRFEVLFDDQKQVFSFDDVKVATVLGRKKLNVYLSDALYQVKGDEHFCALKYMNLYYNFQNRKGDTDNDGFLGI